MKQNYHSRVMMWFKYFLSCDDDVLEYWVDKISGENKAADEALDAILALADD